MKSLIFIICLILLFLFEISWITNIYFPFIIVFNILILLSSALSIELISKKIFSKSKLLKKNKKIIIISSNTVLIFSSLILLFLTTIEAVRNDNALNKIRSLEIKTEITIPTADQEISKGNTISGLRNRLILSDENKNNYFFISDDFIIHEQIATNTHKFYVTHRPMRAEELYGKQIEVLEDIRLLYSNFNGLIIKSNFNIASINGTSTLKISFYTNSINFATYNVDNIPIVEKNENKYFWIDTSKAFKNLGVRYDKLQKTKILK